jgi:hypothetical protein
MRRLLFVGWRSSVDRVEIDEFQGRAHFPIGAAPGELGGEPPEIDLVLIAERTGAETMLLVVVRATEADAKNVVRPFPDACIGSRPQMGKVDRASVAAWDTAAMRFDPTPVPRPHLLHRYPHPQPWSLQPIG